MQNNLKGEKRFFKIVASSCMARPNGDVGPNAPGGARSVHLRPSVRPNGSIDLGFSKGAKVIWLYTAVVSEWVAQGAPEVDPRWGSIEKALGFGELRHLLSIHYIIQRDSDGQVEMG